MNVLNHIMITRSKQSKMKIEIDFDEASGAWMKNKKRVGQGYVYICGATCKNGKKCVKCVSNAEVYCRVHAKTTYAAYYVNIQEC